MIVDLYDRQSRWLAKVRIAEMAGVVLFQGRVFMSVGHGHEYYETTNTRIIEVIESRGTIASETAKGTGTGASPAIAHSSRVWRWSAAD